METEIKNKSQPWWVIFLIIPILFSCNSPILWNVAVSIGNHFIDTFVGKFIEQIFDELGERISHESRHGYVIPDADNPLHGTFSTNIEFKFNDPITGEHRVITLDKPTMDWEPENSRWELDSKSKEIFISSKTSEQKSPETNEKTGFSVILIFVGIGITIALLFVFLVVMQSS